MARQALDQPGDAFIVLVDLVGQVPAAKRLALTVFSRELFGETQVDFHFFFRLALVPEAARIVDAEEEMSSRCARPG